MKSRAYSFHLSSLPSPPSPIFCSPEASTKHAIKKLHHAQPISTLSHQKKESLKHSSDFNDLKTWTAKISFFCKCKLKIYKNCATKLFWLCFSCFVIIVISTVLCSSFGPGIVDGFSFCHLLLKFLWKWIMLKRDSSLMDDPQKPQKTFPSQEILPLWTFKNQECFLVQ